MSLTVAVNEKDHMQGNPRGLIELVEYGDYQCPYCREAYYKIKELQRDYDQELRLVFRNFPLSNMHPYAKQAAAASEAASKQYKFWDMHDYLFEHQSEFNNLSFGYFADILGLDLDRFEHDVAEIYEDPSSKIETDMYSGIRSGVAGTPTLFVNGVKFNGSWMDNQIRFLFDGIINVG